MFKHLGKMEMTYQLWFPIIYLERLRIAVRSLEVPVSWEGEQEVVSMMCCWEGETDVPLSQWQIHGVY